MSDKAKPDLLAKAMLRVYEERVAPAKPAKDVPNHSASAPPATISDSPERRTI